MASLIGGNSLVDFDQRSLAGMQPSTAFHPDRNLSAFIVAAAAIAFNPIFWK